MENKLCNLRDLANRFKRFGLSIDWLKAEADAGRIPCLKVGRKRLFDIAAVEQALLHLAASPTAKKKVGRMAIAEVAETAKAEQNGK